jgi:hypothetical protein
VEDYDVFVWDRNAECPGGQWTLYDRISATSRNHAMDKFKFDLVRDVGWSAARKWQIKVRKTIHGAGCYRSGTHTCIDSKTIERIKQQKLSEQLVAVA